MPKLTQEAIDIFCPEHGRTSCDDRNVRNGFGGWTGKYDETTGERKIIWPRCNRCYLLLHIGEEISGLEFRPDIVLEPVAENMHKP